MQILGNLIVLATAIFGILNRDTMDPSSLGMAVSFAMQVGELIWELPHWNMFSNDNCYRNCNTTGTTLA